MTDPASCVDLPRSVRGSMPVDRHAQAVEEAQAQTQPPQAGVEALVAGAVEKRESLLGQEAAAEVHQL